MFRLYPKAFSHELVDKIWAAKGRLKGTTISGGQHQIDLIAKKRLSDDLLNEMLESLERLDGVQKGQAIHQAKLLIVDPGGREQVLHADSYEDFSAFICHLNDEPMPATEVLLEYKPPVMVQLEPEPIPAASTWPVPWPMNKFLQETANKGDVMWFLANQRHRGPANPSEIERRVLFLVLGPPFKNNGERFDDESSVYEFEHAKNVHGPGSDHHITALRRYDDPVTPTNPVPYDPVMHYWDKRDPNQKEYNALRAKLGPKQRVGFSPNALDLLASAAASSQDKDDAKSS